MPCITSIVAAMGVERAPRGKHHRRGAGQRDHQHQAEGQQGQPAKRLEQRRQAGAMSRRSAPSARPAAIDVATAAGSAPGCRSTSMIAGKRQVGLGRRRTKPALERPAKIVADRPDRPEPRPGAERAAAIAAGALGRSVGDLDRIAMLDPGPDHRAGVGKREAGGGDDHHDEGHDRDQQRHRPAHAARRDQPAFGVRDGEAGHGAPVTPSRADA